MTMETYRLEVEEMTEREGLTADLYGEDDLVEASTRVAYEDHGLEPSDDREDDVRVTREVTTDVTTIDVQFERDDAGFAFRVLGDRDEIATERLDDEELGVA